ncbi:MAG TPA: glutathione ABC transporter substrate-binding protein GsiB [Casimicrobiaceae bacterium]|jgi:glutathione transport system substrate-binding protein|nr:glutathione ABC transporter substrate-binding protein GsiB [Casimicrobiaceae bacterium]
MKNLHRSLAAALFAVAASGAGQALAAKDVVFAVASTFTTTDPYDANDTLSQAMAKSFYEGLFGFDKDMKLIPVLAESYDVSKDGLVYTIKLRKGVKFHDGTDFKADAVKTCLDRVTNPDNKLKRYGLYNNNIAKTEVVDDYTARITLKAPFSPFINQLAHPSTVMISPAALKQWGNKDIAFHPVGTGPFKFVEWKATDYLKVAKFDGYWKKGYPKVDTITWKPVVDNNTRASVMQTGEAHFTFPVPYEMAEVLKSKPDLELVAAPSIVLRYLAMNVLQKPLDNPKVREAINYAINKDALAKVAFAGYATPAEGVAPQGVEYAVKIGPWPYDVAKAKQLLTEAGYPNGFETELWSGYNHSTAQKVTQFLQQQLQQVGIRTKITLLEAGQRVEKVESWQDPKTAPVRLYYIGWSTSTGEADWALRPLLATDSWVPKLSNYTFYSNPRFDADIKNAQLTTDSTKKAELYRDAQQTAWNDAAWAPLVVEKLLSANNKKLSGVYVIPDASFNFTEVDLK